MLRILRSCSLLLLSALPWLAPSPASGQSGPIQPLSAEERDGRHDFDFWVGSTWKGHNRRLLNPLTGSTTWVEFDAVAAAHPIMDGLGNIEEAENFSPSGRFKGMTLRLYDPKAHQWSIYWWNPSNGPMGVPTIGQFRNGRGEFFDQEMFQGRSILVRYVWSNITADSAQFEQSFSVDGGRSWEANWITQWVRQ